MLVAAEVVDDSPPFRAVNHVGIEAARRARLKRADPGDGFTPQRIAIRVVLDGEGYVLALFGKHDPPPRAAIEKWQCERRAVPEPLHNAAPNRGDIVAAAEAETLLYLWVQAGKLGAKRLLV